MQEEEDFIGQFLYDNMM